MEKPVDDTADKDTLTNMVQSEADQKLGKHFTRRKVRTRVRSGICEVCSNPCSTYDHIKLAHMGSKADNFSYETFCGYSINKRDVLAFGNRASTNLHDIASEARNLPGLNSTEDSSSEKADNNASLRSLDVAGSSPESKMFPKLSSSGAVSDNQLSPKSRCTSDQKALENKFENSRTGEVHGDDTSCVNGADHMDMTASCDNKNTNKNLSGSKDLDASLRPEGSIAIEDHKSDLPQMSSDDADMASGSPKSQGRNEDNDSSMHNTNLKLEREPDNNCGNQLDLQHEKLNDSAELAGTQEHAHLRSASNDDNEESELVEQDVKVCDICGDAGQEDKLAICSRCTDGAEHIYCMKERRQKVPEGYWLCEDCQEAEDNENQKQGLEGRQQDKVSAHTSKKRPLEMRDVATASKGKVVDTNLESPKSLSPNKAGALSRDISFKSLEKGKMNPSHQASFGKYSSNDSSDVSRSTSTDSQHQEAKSTLLKSNSFNSFNSKPKVKLVDPVPLKTKSSRETASFGRSMSYRSTHSSRFGASESKVKMLPSKFPFAQDVRKSKHTNDLAFDGKSSSKLDRTPGNSVSSSNISTSKVDQKVFPHGGSVMVPSPRNNRDPKASHSDSKSASLSRATSFVARKSADGAANSVRASTNGVTTVEQVSNQASPKNQPTSSPSWSADRQTDNENLRDGLPKKRESSSQDEKTRESSGSRLKPAGARPSDITCQKCWEIGHSAQYCSSCTASASNNDNSIAGSHRDEELKSSKLKAAIEAAMLKKPGIYRNRKESNSSDGTHSASVEIKGENTSQDQLSGLNTATNVPSDEGMKECQVNSKSCSDAHKQLNKQISFNKSEGMNECQMNSRSSSDFHKQLNKQISFNKSEGMNECQVNSRSSSDFNQHLSKQISFDNSNSLLPLRTRTLESTFSSTEKPHTMTATNVLARASSIPEHDYIWQGSFEVHRGGKVLDLHFGIQAHLSTCASPKVSEVIDKFPPRITFNEVPRISIWPRQFHYNGAKEDNIALYFFARDLISFEKSYKNLLDNMIKKDLALRGCFDGVELLVFPSTLLPENSQSWNMLLFLWGVFRARKSNCSDPSMNLVKKFLNVAPVNKHVVKASLPEKLSSEDQMDKETSVHDNSSDVALSSNSSDKSSMSLNGDSDKKVAVALPISDQSKCDSRSSLEVAEGNSQLVSKMEHHSPLLGNTELDAAVKLSTLAREMKYDSQDMEMQMNSSASGKQDALSHTVPSLVKPDLDAGKSAHTVSSLVKPDGHTVFSLVNLDLDAGKSVGSDGVKKADQMDTDGVQVKIKVDLNEVDASMETDVVSGDLATEVFNSGQLTQRKRPCIDLSETGPENCSSTSPKRSWNKPESSNKKQKTGDTEVYTSGILGDGKTFGESSASNSSDLGPSFSTKEKGSERAPQKKVVLDDWESKERYFFPVGSHHANDLQFVGGTAPWKQLPINIEERSSHDRVPNLELALGGERKSPDKGILPFFVGNNDLNKAPQQEAIREEDGMSASLSLSLSFPFSEMEQTTRSVSKSDQNMPEKHRANSSLLLFGGLSDK